MMAVLSRPDWRDSMSLPCAGHRLGRVRRADVKGLRIGLLLDAGWGLAVEPEVRAAVEPAARAFERAGAIVEPMRAVHDARHARRHGPLLAHALAGSTCSALPPERRAKVLPYIRAWADSAAGMTRRAGVPRLQPDSARCATPRSPPAGRSTT